MGRTIIIILSVALIVSLGLNIIQAMIYDNNMTVYHEELMEWQDYADSLEEIVEEWEVWIE